MIRACCGLLSFGQRRYGRYGTLKWETSTETVAVKGSLYYLAEAAKLIERFAPFFIDGVYEPPA